MEIYNDGIYLTLPSVRLKMHYTEKGFNSFENYLLHQTRIVRSEENDATLACLYEMTVITAAVL